MQAGAPVRRDAGDRGSGQARPQGWARVWEGAGPQGMRRGKSYEHGRTAQAVDLGGRLLISVEKKDLAGEKNVVSLHSIWSPKRMCRSPCSGRGANELGVKRESGESPEQSRCCELRSAAAPENGEPLCHRHRCTGRSGGGERVRRPAKSERWKAFEERAEIGAHGGVCAGAEKRFSPPLFHLFRVESYFEEQKQNSIDRL